MVDGLVVPEWAKSNHHFIFMNALALEHNHVRENLNSWVYLIFGCKQQKGADAYNLFKPLTCEVSVGLEL